MKPYEEGQCLDCWKKLLHMGSHTERTINQWTIYLAP